jgi:DNA invertase Pin-like site-specific DNA recombinase
MKNNKPTNAIIYCRVSPKGRRGEVSGEEAAAGSMETQLGMMRRYCEEKGYIIAGEFCDEYKSGDDEERPGLWDAIASCERGYVLVVWRRDRLARSVFLSELITKDLAKVKAKVESVEGNNGDSFEDNLVRGILAVVAEYERKVNAHRTKVHMIAKQRMGYRMSSVKQPPMGTNVDPRNKKKLQINEPEMDLLTWIDRMKRAGWGYRAIARQLNHRGTEFRGRTGCWDASTIRRAHRRWVAGELPAPPPTETGIPPGVPVPPSDQSQITAIELLS